MKIITLFAALAAAIHALTYAWWLKGQGNRPGAALVIALTLAVMGLTVARMVTS